MTPHTFQRFMAGDTGEKLNICSPSHPSNEMDEVSADGLPVPRAPWRQDKAASPRTLPASCPRPHLAALSPDPVSFHSVPGDPVGFLFRIPFRSLAHCFSLSLHQNFLLSPKQLISPAQLGLRSLPLILPSPGPTAGCPVASRGSHTGVCLLSRRAVGPVFSVWRVQGGQLCSRFQKISYQIDETKAAL